MTVVDRLDELQASAVGRRECSSTRQSDPWTTHTVSPAHRRRVVATAQARVMEVSQLRKVAEFARGRAANSEWK